MDYPAASGGIRALQKQRTFHLQDFAHLEALDGSSYI
jgi:hypothetical protein